jgi:hypothetical protein
MTFGVEENILELEIAIEDIKIVEGDREFGVLYRNGTRVLQVVPNVAVWRTLESDEDFQIINKRTTNFSDQIMHSDRFVLLGSRTARKRPQTVADRTVNMSIDICRLAGRAVRRISISS